MKKYIQKSLLFICLFLYITHNKTAENIKPIEGFLSSDEVKHFFKNIIQAPQEEIITYKEDTHEEIRFYSCPHCEKNFSQKTNMLRHARIHKNIKPYMCETCLERYSDKSNFNRHKKKHLNIKHFACNECEKSYTTKVNLTRHINNNHKND